MNPDIFGEISEFSEDENLMLISKDSYKGFKNRSKFNNMKKIIKYLNSINFNKFKLTNLKYLIKLNNVIDEKMNNVLRNMNLNETIELISNIFNVNNDELLTLFENFQIGDDFKYEDLDITFIDSGIRNRTIELNANENGIWINLINKNMGYDLNLFPNKKNIISALFFLILIRYAEEWFTSKYQYKEAWDIIKNF
jgi:hypothetical protein